MSIMDETRREEVIEALRFIGDWCRLDTQTLILRAQHEDDFVHAVAAVMHTGTTWQGLQALRDFSVQALIGVRRVTDAAVRILPDVRASPFSVPAALLREWRGNSRIEPFRDTHTFEIGPDTLQHAFQFTRRPRLFTTVWGRLLQPSMLLHHAARLHIISVGANRLLYDGHLWACCEAPMVMLHPNGPNDNLRIEITWLVPLGQAKPPPPPCSGMLVFEGWEKQD